MEINIQDYLSKEEIAEICKEEIRNIIRKTKEEDIARIIGNSAYYKVFDKVDGLLPNGYEDKIVKKVNDIVDGMNSFGLIRYNYSTGLPESTGAKIIEKAVKEREQYIINKVNKAIDAKFNQSDDDLYSEFVERFLDNMYNGFDISFTRKEDKWMQLKIKVYIVFEYDYSNTEILKIYTNEETAKKYAKKLNKEHKGREFGYEKYEVEVN